VVGGGDADGVDLLHGEEFAEVLEDGRFDAAAGFDDAGGAGEVFVVEIAEGGDVDVGVFEEAVEAAGAHVADADEADVDAVVGGGEGGAGGSEKGATSHLAILLNCWLR